MKGFFDSFVYPLIVTILDNALCATQRPLYKQPFMYILCINDITVSTYGVQRSVFLEVSLHESAITSVIFLGRFVFQKLSLISERLIISYSNKCFADLLTAKDSIFGDFGKFFSNDTVMGNQNCVFQHGIIMILDHIYCLTIAIAALVRLKEEIA